MDKMVVVDSFLLPHEAHIARASLESAGIRVQLADEHTVTTDWLYAQAIGGIKLLVPEAQLAEARAILQTDYSADLDELIDASEDYCPRCGSSDVRAHTRGKTGAFLTFALLHFPFFPYKNGMKCAACDYFWKN